MDNTTPDSLLPEIVTANYARFEEGQIVTNPSVESRMCLWCNSGQGEIVVNRKRLPVRAFDYFMLPWRHSIRYEPAPETPFTLAGIHIIPWHDPTVALEWGVAHNAGHHLYGVPWRRDHAIEGVEPFLHFHLSHNHTLLHLSEYIVQRIGRGDRDRQQRQRCAHMLIDEIRHTAQQAPARPGRLRDLERFIQRNIHRPISVSDLAAAIDRSTSQVTRLCRLHLDRTPGQWVTKRKIDSACHLLRTTRLSVAEVARRVGYEDQFHFSRVFKRHTGIAPLKYRRQQPLL